MSNKKTFEKVYSGGLRFDPFRFESGQTEKTNLNFNFHTSL